MIEGIVVGLVVALLIFLAGKWWKRLTAPTLTLEFDSELTGWNQLLQGDDRHYDYYRLRVRTSNGKEAKNASIAIARLSELKDNEETSLTNSSLPLSWTRALGRQVLETLPAGEGALADLVKVPHGKTWQYFAPYPGNGCHFKELRPGNFILELIARADDAKPGSLKLSFRNSPRLEVPEVSVI